MPPAACASTRPPVGCGGPGRRGGVGPGARRPASGRSPQALAERGWLMLVCPRRCRLLVSLTVLLLAWSSAGVAVEARAAQQPTQVSVRVVGAAPAFTPLVPLTLVTTTTAPVVKDGGNCSGTSAAGALDIATKGNWEGHWNSGFSDYEVISIEGQAYPFEPG